MSSSHAYAALLGLRAHDLANLLKSVEQGFSFQTLERLQRNLDVPWTDLLDLIDIPARTFARRKQEGRFSPDESERILRAARIYAKAIEVFDGDRGVATTWLATVQQALGGAKPLDLARKEIGAREVEALLDRLEHGVFS